MGILVINGPNLNMLGKREPEIYGSQSLDDIMLMCKNVADKSNVMFEHFQSNHEGQIIDFIQNEAEKYSFIIANIGAYTHTSIAIRDAFLSLTKRPNIIELHVSNVYKREEFRHKSYISAISIAVMCGFGSKGYLLATQFCVDEMTG